MYTQFVQEFRGGSVSSVKERRATFENKVKAMVAHNTDTSKTWKKGINEFSDMTHEEFVQARRIVGDP